MSAIKNGISQTEYLDVRFQVLTAASTKITAFWDIAPTVFLHLIITHFPIVPGKIPPGPTESDISTRCLSRGLFIALTIQAVRTSETSVYFDETTRHYISEGYYLQSI
jgi:hypothetical protein